MSGYEKITQALNAINKSEEYLQSFKGHEMDDETVAELVRDPELAIHLGEVLPIVGHRIKFLVQFKKLITENPPAAVINSPNIQSSSSCDITPISSSPVFSLGELSDVGISLENLTSSNVLNQDIVALADATTQNKELPTSSETTTLLEPVKKARKKRAAPSTWKVNIKKKLRMEGEDYLGRKKEIKDGKVLQVQVKKNGRKIRDRCSCKSSKRASCSKLSEQDRTENFEYFWKSLKDWNTRKIYIASITDIKEPKRKNFTADLKQKTYKYKLIKNREKVLVCRKMFLNSLGISRDEFYSWMTKLKSRKVGSSTRPNEYSISPSKQFLINFLKSMPKVPSHYCRAKSNKVYLEPGINSQAELYRLYEAKCNENQMQKLSSASLAKEIENLNISLFIPKKDQCNLCKSYELDQEDEDTYNAHITRKNEARKAKEHDKEEAQEEKSHVLTVDVQQIQLAPKVLANAGYFKQKLASHNYTVANLGNQKVFNYWWNESEGGLFSSNFASCLMNYLEENCTGGLPIIIFSDGCTAQNRNVYLSNAILNFSMKHQVEVQQKFLEKGHTYMECDTAHGLIERKLKNKEIFNPQQYVQLSQEARIKPFPYEAKELTYKFFKDFSKLENFPYKNIRPGSNKSQFKVVDLRVLKYTPAGNIFYKLNYSDEFKELPNKKKLKTSASLSDFPRMYSKKLPISFSKWSDLQDLKLVIPKDFHKFYDELPHEKKKNKKKS